MENITSSSFLFDLLLSHLSLFLFSTLSLYSFAAYLTPLWDQWSSFALNLNCFAYLSTILLREDFKTEWRTVCWWHWTELSMSQKIVWDERAWQRIVIFLNK